jgi:hypothetical protein
MRPYSDTRGAHRAAKIHSQPIRRVPERIADRANSLASEITMRTTAARLVTKPGEYPYAAPRSRGRFSRFSGSMGVKFDPIMRRLVGIESSESQ